MKIKNHWIYISDVETFKKVYVVAYVEKYKNVNKSWDFLIILMSVNIFLSAEETSVSAIGYWT